MVDASYCKYWLPRKEHETSSPNACIQNEILRTYCIVVRVLLVDQNSLCSLFPLWVACVHAIKSLFSLSCP